MTCKARVFCFSKLIRMQALPYRSHCFPYASQSGFSGNTGCGIRSERTYLALVSGVGIEPTTT
jgi:hypothetical protein